MYTQDHGRRHVFELNCANGDRWHLHFHQRGNCDRKHLPFDATRQRLNADTDNEDAATEHIEVPSYLQLFKISHDV